MPRFFPAFIALFMTGALPVVTQAQSNWTLQASGADLRSVAAAEGMLVAVGHDGNIMTSTDGAAWKTRKSNTGQNLLAALWMENGFLVGGEGGILLHSKDGAAWTNAKLETKVDFRSMVWTGKLAFALGQSALSPASSEIWSSPDGVSWTLCSNSLPAKAGQLVWTGRELFVSRGTSLIEAAALYASSDGKTWVLRESSNLPEFIDLLWADSMFVGMTNHHFHTSADGKTWTRWSAPYSDPSEGGTMASLAWTGKSFIAIGKSIGPGPNGSITSGNRILASSDGQNWIQTGANPEIPLMNFQDVIWSGEQFVAIGSGPSVLTSKDGKDWVIRLHGPGDANEIKSIHWDGNQLLGVGHHPWGLLSTDGISWEKGGSTHRFFAVTKMNESWVALSSNIPNAFDSKKSFVSLSTDGFQWKSQILADSVDMNSVGWSGNLLVAVGQNGQIRTSPDGKTWSRQRLSVGNNLNHVTWANGMWVVSGSLGTILTSRDGQSWVTRASGTQEHLYAAAWNGVKWVVAGEGGAILTSLDGRFWSVKHGYPLVNFTAMVWTGRQFVAAGKREDQGVIFASVDGAEWRLLQTGRLPALNTLAWTGNRLVAGGVRGSLLSSSEDEIRLTPDNPKPAENFSLRHSRAGMIVVIPEAFFGKPVSVAVYSLKGQPLLSMPFDKADTEILVPMAGRPIGPYVLSLEGARKRFSKPFHIER